MHLISHALHPLNHILVSMSTSWSIYGRTSHGVQRSSSPIEAAIANNKYGLTSGLILNKDSSSDIAFNAFNISMTTRTVKDNVEAFTFPIVKYKQGLLCKSIPSMKLTGWKVSFGQEGHYPQFDN